MINLMQITQGNHEHFANHWLLVLYGVIMYNVINYWFSTNKFDKDKSGFLDWKETLHYLNVNKVRILISFLIVPIGVWGCEPIYGLLVKQWPDIFPTFKEVGDFAYIIMGALPALLQLLLTKIGLKK